MAARRRRRQQPWWALLPTEELLDVRLCDLGLSIEGTALGRRIDRLHAELRRAGLVFRPYVWLSTDWFTPEGSTGFAVPFYLAHRRLVRLEHAQMFEAEGSTHDWCMKLLRHEAAHAMDNAYRLHRRDDWRRTFGRYSAPYRSAYQVRPTSKHYVQHLGSWYAQSHPAEDYAESFAVWLAPNSRWQKAYEGWPALQKLRQLDKILRDIGDLPPTVRTRDRAESLPRLKITLRDFYRRKKASYGTQQPWRHDRELRLVFAEPGPGSRRERAATFLKGARVELRSKVSALTGQYRYVVDQAIDAMAARCRELDLRLSRPRDQARLGAAVLTTMVTLALSRGHKPRFRR
ncbi:MAG: putative zinc-binding metallopeptidase [Planctomycetes bacterium]|nr:putative zinc-binding metallopeptidase [Planctomycetota bacterium]